MKCSESWLREWVNPSITRDVLCDKLTMAGLEVEEVAPVAKAFSHVLIGEVRHVEKHPDSDRLHLCKVSVGQRDDLAIVCGATNVREGLKVPVAMLGAELPNGLVIKEAKIRGAASYGMLCTISELGLAEESDGLWELPADAPIGESLRTYLDLDDYTIDVSITPNRGDCLSVKGLAREISALTKTPIDEVAIPDVKATIKDVLSVSVKDEAGCPRYVGRIVRGVNANAETPMWMKEQLRRSGVRVISAIVDVTNYVMLELGQPMHAFDLNKVHKEVIVRHSKAGEVIALLDGTTKTLNDKTLVIADHDKPLAIAGVMGGLDSAVSLETKDVFLESAYFSPETIAKSRQHYQLISDSAYRFERGIDPTLQAAAIARATQLILEIAGGEVGELTEVIAKSHLPSERVITLSLEKLTQVLGVAISEEDVADVFTALKFKHHFNNGVVTVNVPPYRSDITLPEDLIEEVARLYGYDNIPTKPLEAVLHAEAKDIGVRTDFIKRLLCDQDFHEIISYSFVDPALQTLLDPDISPKSLSNPITAEMAVMRTNLLPGLIQSLLYNTARQQDRVRLFEMGVCFIPEGKSIRHESRLGAVITGFANEEQWGQVARKVDFYDAKGSVEQILNLLSLQEPVTFKEIKHPALHPGQSAAIYLGAKNIGMLGALHPQILQNLGLNEKVFVFELNIEPLLTKAKLKLKEVSKFPDIRRDIAILIEETVRSKDIQDIIRRSAGDWLYDVFIFDVYQGKGITPGMKSIALALVWQHPTRTLVDEEVTALMSNVINTLKGQFGAELRS